MRHLPDIAQVGAAAWLDAWLLRRERDDLVGDLYEAAVCGHPDCCIGVEDEWLGQAVGDLLAHLDERVAS